MHQTAKHQPTSFHLQQELVPHLEARDPVGYWQAHDRRRSPQPRTPAAAAATAAGATCAGSTATRCCCRTEARSCPDVVNLQAVPCTSTTPRALFSQQTLATAAPPTRIHAAAAAIAATIAAAAAAAAAGLPEACHQPPIVQLDADT